MALQYSCLGNPMDGGAQWAAVRGGRTESNRTEATLNAYMRWRRKWPPTPVFLPGESQGQRSLMGCHLWGCTELDRLRSSSSNIFIRLLSQCFAGYTKLVTNYFLSNFSGRVFFFFNLILFLLYIFEKICQWKHPDQEFLLFSLLLFLL